MIHPDYLPPKSFLLACKTLDFSEVPKVVPCLARFVELLLETNRYINLTAIQKPDHAWIRHVLDSLSLLPYLGSAGTIIDIGSGGGLPAIPLAILEPDRSFTLLEATRKKVTFLHTVATELDLANVTILHARAETAGQQPLYRESFDLCVSRSVAPLPTLLEYMLPFVRRGGRLLCMKGAAAKDEVSRARHANQTLGGRVIALHKPLPDIEDTATVIEIEKRQPTPPTYPRYPGVPKKMPL